MAVIVGNPRGFSYNNGLVRIHTCEVGLVCRLCELFGRDVYLCDFTMLVRHLKEHLKIDPKVVPENVCNHVQWLADEERMVEHE